MISSRAKKTINEGSIIEAAGFIFPASLILGKIEQPVHIEIGANC